MSLKYYTKSEFKKVNGFDRAVNTLTTIHGKGYNEALDIADEMTTRQLYKFLKDNGWAWSVALEKWVTIPNNQFTTISLATQSSG